ncbi:MAG: LTA synthase family protein [Bacteroidales bacterium]|nr:LTA synthase family protein [Bacteroidales bacterium]
MLKQQIFSLLRQLLFWLLVFATGRLLFLVYVSGSVRTAGIPISEVLQTFYYALMLDISTASYLLIIPFFLLLIQSYFRAGWADAFNKVYTAVVLLVFLLITVAELALYAEWESKLSFKALVYLRHPAEVINSVSNRQLFAGLFLVIVQFLFFCWLYKRCFYKPFIRNQKTRRIWKAVFVLLAPGLLLLGIRGGFGEIPITSSKSYFSKNNLLNLAAVNSAYNLVFSAIDYFQIKESNRFSTLPSDKAKALVGQIHEVSKDSTVSVLNSSRPNIVIILLESWPGDVIESLGGEAGITPEFSKLEKDGLLFTNFYATGNRSQQAMASIYGGLPALPVTTLADHPEKYYAVPSLVKKLNEEGYYSSFYFGGQLMYGNIKSFLVYNEFDRLVEGDDFDSQVPRGKMGVHDEFLFERFARELDTGPRPFFATAFTLSSHSPYDQPGERPIKHIESENDFVNSVFYADQALGRFFEQVKTKPWFDSTLFVILSDHSHPSYKNYPLRTFEYHNIPFLLCGGALKKEFMGKQNDRIFSNADLTRTLLRQLDLPADDFFWSRDIFNPYSPEYAYFDLTTGFGWKRPFGEIVLKLEDNYHYVNKVDESREKELEEEGRAYVQVLFEEFLGW